MLANRLVVEEGEGESGARFTMLTIEPGPDSQGFHARQVVALPPNAWGAWLYLEKSEAEILQPLPAGSLRVSLSRPGREAPPAELLKRVGHSE